MLLRFSSLIMIFAFSLSFACTHGGGHHGAKHGSKWKEMDADKDGKVTKEEFLKQHESYFAKHDLDNDGIVTEEEIKSCQDGKMKKSSEGTESKADSKANY